jgi:hypothetical protein
MRRREVATRMRARVSKDPGGIALPYGLHRGSEDPNRHWAEALSDPHGASPLDPPAAVRAADPATARTRLPQPLGALCRIVVTGEATHIWEST